ncbi:MAG: hypothetical protein KBF74_01495 [Ferruginibacter sp.]|nr:hypothetical protein [Ferruginibacter sp.]
MHKIIMLITVVGCLHVTQTVLAQNDDPFTKLKQLAQKQPVQKQTLAKKAFIKENDPSFRVFKKNPIAFAPFEIKDGTGKLVSPTDMITLSNGKTVVAGDYYKQVNEIEKDMNAKGYSLRNKDVLRSEIIRNKKLYDNKLRLMPAKVGPLLSEKELSKYLNPSLKVGNLTLKPILKYTAAEKDAVNKMMFSKTNGKFTAISRPMSAKKPHVIMPATPRLVKELKYDFAKSWPTDREYLGDPEKFAVAVNTGFGLHIKQYSRCDPRLDPSTYSAYAQCTAKGSLFGNAFNILKADANITVPAKLTSTSSVNLVVAVAGINLVNEHNDASTFQVNMSERPAVMSIDKSLQLSVPIVGPITFEGSVGVRGYAGLDYGLSVDKLNLVLRVYPNAQIAGYAEAGLGFGFGEVGVGAELTFLSVGFPLNGGIGVVVDNEDQLVIVTHYNLGYSVKELNGRLYLYADLCWPFPKVCGRIAEVNIFSWDGFIQSGAFAQAINFDPINR